MITFIDKYEEIKKKYNYLSEKKYLFNIQFFLNKLVKILKIKK